MSYRALPLFFVLLGIGLAEPVEYSRALELYQSTNYQQSLSVLLSIEHKDEPILQLIGQNYFMIGDYKKSAEYLEKAAAIPPESSDCFMWLGRAYGRRAETSSPFTAPGYASKSRQMLERAVALNPANKEAVGDLFDFYLEAPGFMGGGEHKAETLATIVAQHDPAEGHYYEAQLADRRKQHESEEEHLRKALELAPKQAGRFVDLAKFLANHGRVKESDDLFDQAFRLYPDNPKLMFERASIYVKERRNLDRARDLLHRYLNLPLTPNDPPKHDAEALLKKIGA